MTNSSLKSNTMALLSEVAKIVQRGLQDQAAKIYFYGSWVSGEAGRASDIDVAIWPQKPLPLGLLGDIREMLYQSTIPYPVELVDLSTTDEAFRQRVLTEGILWKEVVND